MSTFAIIMMITAIVETIILGVLAIKLGSEPPRDAEAFVATNHLFIEEGLDVKEYLEALDSVVSKRYPKQMYRIGGYQEAAICLQPEGSCWVVYNGERGNMYFEVQCNTILMACLEFIRKLTHDDSEIEIMEKELIVALATKQQ